MSAQTEPALRNLSVEDITGYLDATEWKRVDTPNRNWIVYVGGSDDKGCPIELVLPARETNPDFLAYATNVVSLLGALHEISPVAMANQIASHPFDILRLRTLERNALPLDTAATQVGQLKQLVAYGACSEQDPRPYFPAKLAVADTTVAHYEFAHTEHGSFVFRIQSRVVPLLDNAFTPHVQAPIERRVMERIMRGLAITNEAVRAHDATSLVEKYAIGLNANMCEALRSISQGEDLVEYSVSWSPRLQPSQDVATPRSLTLIPASKDVLGEAAQRLREHEPVQVVVHGRIVALASEGDPHKNLEVPRSVVVLWDRPDRRVKISVCLGTDDYVQAIRAHEDWSTVEVKGSAERTSDGYRLADPHDFRVVW